VKFTIYVPDDLWNRVREHGEGRNPSQVVQHALRLMTAGPTFRSVAKTPPFDLSEIAAKKAAEAQSMYEDAYSQCLDVVEFWPFEALDWLAQRDFELSTLPTEDLGRDDPEYVEFMLPDDLEHVYAPFDLGHDLREIGWGFRGELFELGLRQALRDVWQAALSAALSDPRPEVEADDEDDRGSAQPTPRAKAPNKRLEVVKPPRDGQADN